MFNRSHRLCAETTAAVGVPEKGAVIFLAHLSKGQNCFFFHFQATIRVSCRDKSVLIHSGWREQGGKNEQGLPSSIV